MTKQKSNKRKTQSSRKLLIVAGLGALALAGIALHRTDSSREELATAEQNGSAEKAVDRIPITLATTQQQEVAVPPPQPPALPMYERAQRVGTLLVDAKRALAQQDFAGASAKAEEALTLDPDSRSARTMKEKVSEEKQEAEAEQREEQVGLYQRQGREALSRSDIPAALTALEEARKLDPSDAKTFRLIERAHELQHSQEMRKMRQGFLQSRAVEAEPIPPNNPKVNWNKEEQTGEYTIQPEDVLEITVYEEPDLTTKARVSRSGDITFPMLGQVPVSGLSVTQVQERITQLLEEDYLVHPQVQVFVDKPRNVFVTGQVHKPGSYPVSVERPTTVLEIISLAGGFTQDANLNGTRIIRVEKGQKQTIPVRVGDVIRKGDKTQDEVVQPDDIIFVPESFF